MSDNPRPPRVSPWANARPLPEGHRPDKRERAAARNADAGPAAPPRTPHDPRQLRREDASHAARVGQDDPRDANVARGEPRAAPAHHSEIRYFGRNACHAVFAHRPDDIRKVYLTEARIPEFKAVLAWLVQHKLGYRVVETADLDKLTQTQHHEGVCFDLRRTVPLTLAALLQQLQPAPAPALLIQLDGVGNPHNFGAMLRSAAHFGIQGVLLPADSTLGLSGAAARVAEGGAEAVTIAQAQPRDDVAGLLHRAGFSIAATVPREGVSLYAGKLPQRLVLVFGAEGEGLGDSSIQAADLRLTIPGSGAVESLNISASAAVLCAEYFRQRQS